MKYIVVVSFFLVFSTLSFSQTHADWETLLENIISIDEAEDENWEDNYELLYELAENPIDINTATTDDLKKLFFLSASQIQDIEEYKYKYGRVHSISELAMIESIDSQTRELLNVFLYATPDANADSFPSLGNILKYGNHELMASAQIPFYKRKGDENGYLGYQYRHWLRYTFKRGDWVKAGVVAAQDAGEPFFASKNSTGYDYYSPYLLLKKLGRIKALALGRYRLKFGMGLVMNNSLSFGKLAMLSSLSSSQNSIRAHSSRSEGNYMQGVATTINVINGLDVTAFASYRNRDATLNDDGSVSTLLTTGYHRTESEMERKNNTHQSAVGGNINYLNNGFHVGITAVFSSLNRDLHPNTNQSFRQYYPSGNSFWNAGIDYGYASRRLNISGETATGDCGALATINSISYDMGNSVVVTALQRFYSYKYNSLFARSFSDVSSVQNESGVYLGATWKPLVWLQLLAFTDYSYHPWAIYQADLASRSWDNYVAATIKSGRITANVRYRYRMRERNAEEENRLIWKKEQRARFSLDYDGGLLSTRSEVGIAGCSYKENGFGWMVAQSVSLSHRQWRLSASAGYFKTDDYDSRIYTYERGMLYEMPYLVFYGRGIRFMLSARANIGRNLMVQAKVGTTDYFDRDHISSGLQQIDASSKTDLWLQARWRF